MKRTIMIVDDRLFIRNLLRSILEGEGYIIVAEAVDGYEAIEKYLKHRPDVTIMDIIMPLLSGIEAAREILSRDDLAKLIICSSVGRDDLEIAARLVGAHGIIPKPFKVGQVLEAVGKVCAGVGRG